MLEADDEIVRISHDDHVARGLAMSPSVGPEIEHVVQVHIGKKRRDHRALPRARVTDREHSVFQHARLKPFLDQVDHASISNPMLQETNQPLLADRIEEASDVRVKNDSSPSCCRSRTSRHPAHHAGCASAGTHTRTRGSLPRRSRSAPRRPPLGRSCLPARRQRAGAAAHRLSGMYRRRDGSAR